MKNLSLLFAIILSVSVFGNTSDTTSTKSKITEVTVYFSGAEVTREVSITLTKGKHLLLIDDLSQEINPQSIQVKGTDKIKVLSTKHQLSYPNSGRKTKEEETVESKIEDQENIIKAINDEISIFGIEESILLENSDFQKKEAGASIAEIKEAVDYYRLRLNEIRTAKRKLMQRFEDSKEKIKVYNAELNKLKVKRQKVYSQILLSIDCSSQLSTKIFIHYYVPSAGWNPVYDFRVKDISSPLNIVYNANVFQSSGENWKDVVMTLSTNNPSISNDKQELKPWRLGRKNQYRKIKIAEGNSSIRGLITDSESGEPIPFANVIMKQDGQMINGASTDFDGNYIIKPIESGYYNLEVTVMGYLNKRIEQVSLQGDKTKFLNVLMEPSHIQLESYTVTDYSVPLIDKNNTVSGESFISSSRKSTTRGSRKDKQPVDGISYTAAGVYKEKTITTNYLSSSLSRAVVNLEYRIDVPYTIPSDGKDYSMKIKEVSLPVEYIYHVVPKIETDVFLSAEIIDWGELNLLSGKSNIYFNGTYVGESVIDAKQTKDTLSISLGRDKGIVVEREINKAMLRKSFLGNNIKETIAYDITVRNNKSIPIKLVVEDQFPISNKGSIKIEHLEYLGARLNERTGKLSWDIELDPNEKKVLSYKYWVKYPNYMDLSFE